MGLACTPSAVTKLRGLCSVAPTHAGKIQDGTRVHTERGHQTPRALLRRTDARWQDSGWDSRAHRARSPNSAGFAPSHRRTLARFRMGLACTPSAVTKLRGLCSVAP